MTDPHHAAAERAIARCRELAQITDVPGQTTRTFLSPAMREANALVTRWMSEAGLSTRIDAAGNLLGRSHPNPLILLASHLDTVVDAGAFDGPLGILLAIEAAHAVPQIPLEIAAFSDEEGVRFGVPFLGSSALTGQLDAATLALTDRDGITVAEAITTFGLPLDRLPQARVTPGLGAYLEIHIEQGPVLEAEDRPLAVVSAIAGQTRLRLHFTGQANHAGTTPMTHRHDALAAAAEWIVAVEQCAHTMEALVATVGSIRAAPDVSNIIPGSVSTSLDLRHGSDSARHTALIHLLTAASHAAARRGVTVRHEIVMDQPAVLMDSRLTASLLTAAATCGHNARALVSGAGHDAMILAPHLPASMLFVRSPGGLSHSPAETVRVADVAAALATTIEFLGSQFGKR